MNTSSPTAFRPIVRWLALALLAGLLSACATGPRLVHTEVTTFDAWASVPAEKTYVFARTLEFQNSLEMQTYEDIVRDELAIQGFRLATDPARAQLTVTLRPSVVGLQVRVREPFGDPFYRPWGGWYGGYGYGRFGGFHDPWPYWGSSFYDTAEVYRRRLEVDIDSKSVPGKRYYEGRAESTGQSNALPPVMPALIRALFTDFPGNSGQTRRVDVPMERAPR
jgi:Domain of unknown function (DUF4136)